VFGLNVGIDFLGGANLELRPQKSMTTAEIRNTLQAFNLLDLQVTTGENTQLPADRTVWIHLNTQIDKNVQDSIQNTLTQKYPGVNVIFSTVPPTSTGGKPFTLVTVIGFSSTPKTADIQSALSKLP